MRFSNINWRGVVLPAFMSLMVTMPAGAAARDKKGKAKAKTEQAVAPDTVSIADFSYAVGLTNTGGLKNYLAMRLNVDTAFIADFIAGLDVEHSTIADQRLRAYMAGIDIRQQIETGILPKLDQQVTGNDTTQAVVRQQFIQGFRQGLLGTAAISVDSAAAVVQRNMQYYEERNMDAKYGEWRAQNERFLEDNAKNKDVTVTASGLQYRIVTKGEGPIPTADQRVKVNYEGRLTDGTVFDSSYKRNQPATFACGQVIKGWTEALTMMPVGSKWELYIPQQLAYGTRETGKIKPFSTLVFTVELLGIEE